MNAVDEGTSLVINGARIETHEQGRGRPILFLHPHIGLDPAAPVFALLAAGGRLIAPSHPGFGRSERSDDLTTVDDLAYFYLDVMDAPTQRTRPSSGSSLGGWIAASMGGEIHRAHIAPGARQPRRYQGRRPRDARHPHIFAMMETISSRRRLRILPRAGAITRRCRPRRLSSPRAIARRRHSLRGRPTCTTRSSRGGCIEFTSRPSSCGALPTASLRKATAARSAPRFRREIHLDRTGRAFSPYRAAAVPLPNRCWPLPSAHDGRPTNHAAIGVKQSRGLPGPSRIHPADRRAGRAAAHRRAPIRIMRSAASPRSRPACRTARRCCSIASRGFRAGFRVFTNAVTNPQRAALALGIDPALRPLDALKAWMEKRQTLTPRTPVEIGKRRLAREFHARRRR